MDKRTMSADEIKQVQLSMLKEFSGFCDQNGLTYYLAYGTLIGAVRHQGFIPWDDDIDIAMPREDYDRLLLLYSRQEKSARYYLAAPRDPISRYTYAKLIDRATVKIEKNLAYSAEGFMGIDIDIFPIDHLPASPFWHKTLFKLKMLIYRMDYFAVSDLKMRTLHGKALAALCRAIGHRKWMNILDRLSHLCKNTSERAGVNASLYNYEREWHRANLFSQKQKLEFEGERYWAPSGFHEWLTDIYGDYMKLPSEEERRSTHEYQAYWAE